MTSENRIVSQVQECQHNNVGTNFLVPQLLDYIPSRVWSSRIRWRIPAFQKYWQVSFSRRHSPVRLRILLWYAVFLCSSRLNFVRPLADRFYSFHPTITGKTMPTSCVRSGLPLLLPIQLSLIAVHRLRAEARPWRWSARVIMRRPHDVSRKPCEQCKEKLWHS